jgi:hypothetical protein
MPAYISSPNILSVFRIPVEPIKVPSSKSGGNFVDVDVLKMFEEHNRQYHSGLRKLSSFVLFHLIHPKRETLSPTRSTKSKRRNDCSEYAWWCGKKRKCNMLCEV